MTDSMNEVKVGNTRDAREAGLPVMRHKVPYEAEAEAKAELCMSPGCDMPYSHS